MIDNPELDQVSLDMLTWKPSVVRDFALTITDALLELGCLHADEVNLTLAANHPACVGIAFRLLRRAGIAMQTGHYRKSVKACSNKRIVFEWRLASAQRAKTFLARNGGKPRVETQQEMFA